MTSSRLDLDPGHFFRVRKLDFIELRVSFVKVSKRWINKGFDRMIFPKDLSHEQFGFRNNGRQILLVPGKQSTVRHDVRKYVEIKPLTGEGGEEILDSVMLEQTPDLSFEFDRIGKLPFGCRFLEGLIGRGTRQKEG